MGDVDAADVAVAEFHQALIARAVEHVAVIVVRELDDDSGAKKCRREESQRLGVFPRQNLSWRVFVNHIPHAASDDDEVRSVQESRPRMRIESVHLFHEVVANTEKSECRVDAGNVDDRKVLEETKIEESADSFSDFLNVGFCFRELVDGEGSIII